MVRSLEVKTYKQIKSSDNSLPSKSTLPLGNYDFDHLIKNCLDEQTNSGRPVFKSILFMRNSNKSLKGPYGEKEPFIPDQNYIDFKKIQHEIGDIRLLLEYC